MNSSDNLTARQKAAILIMSLPPELSAQVIRSFPPEEVQNLTIEMSKTPHVPKEMKESVIKEFLETSDLQIPGTQPVLTPASPAIPRRRAEDKDEKRTLRPGRPFSFLTKTEPEHVLALIEKEHPQTIALVLSNLTAAQATAILQLMKPPLQTETARRLAEIGKVRPEILQDLENILDERFHVLMERGFKEPGNKDALMEILNRSDQATEERILSGLAKKNPRLAKDLQNQLCEFDDIAFLDRMSIHQLLKVTDMQDLVFALKGASTEIANKIYQALLPERAQALKEDVEAQQVSNWKEVREAQQQIRNNLRGLMIIGKIKPASQEKPKFSPKGENASDAK